jgi:hypothetical protein
MLILGDAEREIVSWAMTMDEFCRELLRNDKRREEKSVSKTK